MTVDEEKELAEAVLRTRRWAFRAAYPEGLRVVRRILAGRNTQREDRCCGADRMIRDYREIISQIPEHIRLMGRMGPIRRNSKIPSKTKNYYEYIFFI